MEFFILKKKQVLWSYSCFPALRYHRCFSRLVTCNKIGYKVGGANDDTRRSVAPTITIATHNMGEDEGRKKGTRKREGTGWQFFLKKRKING